MAVSATGLTVSGLVPEIVVLVVPEVVVVVVVTGHVPVRGRQWSRRVSLSFFGRLVDTATVKIFRPALRRLVVTGLSTPTNAPHAEPVKLGNTSPAPAGDFSPAVTSPPPGGRQFGTRASCWFTHVAIRNRQLPSQAPSESHSG